MSQQVLRLSWREVVGAQQLAARIDAAFAAGATRVELLVPETCAELRRAAHQVGMRREGRLRRAVATDQGTVAGLLYAVLDDDQRAGPEVFSTVMNSVLPRTRLISHTLITDRAWTDPAARLLLLEVSYKRDWELPGGVVEPNESPRQGAAREVREELGVEAQLGRLLVLDWLPPYLGWDDAVELIFDGGVLDPATELRLAPGEVVAAHWVTVDQAADRLSPLAARRIRWLSAHRGAAPVYCEAGSPVGS